MSRYQVATLSDVAKLAGVSLATASKALNGRVDVSKATRDRVQEASRSLNFRPNPLASGLIVGTTGTVGLLTNDLEGRFSLPILMGAEDAFGEENVSVFLCDARGDATREQRHLGALLGRRVDGLLIVGDRNDPRPSLGPSIPVPTVYVYAPSESPDDISVLTDDVLGGRIAVEHLLASGRRHIAYVGGDPSYAAARDRAAGAAAALADAAVKPIGGVPMYGHWSERWGREAARLLLDQTPQIDGIFCGSDVIARGVLDGLRERGRSVPDDIAVVGYDNWLAAAVEARPELTSIDMHLARLGSEAAQLLSLAMAGDPPRRRHVVEPSIVLRESTPGRPVHE